MNAERTALAARIYIALRREAKRSIDVEWLLKNTEYAREIIALAKQHSAELMDLATHFESQLPPPLETRQRQHEIHQDAGPVEQAVVASRYVGQLR